ncbi:nucleotidyltransferase domain-containing protein [Pendulispora rubella]|uniref:Nucleotidyltransferase domain-containing protein n=1 Tax=Pendulispora rubella TaxID=2741070 RepID=A0ABZ2LHY7_9BACT
MRFQDDDAFCRYVAGELAGLADVVAVALGGSRAAGTHRPDSDWDFGIYYRGNFSPDALRALGWAGEVCELGAWGGGVFNGGAWLEVDGRRVDVHYRDLNDVELRLAEAREGRFHIERLLFHLAGIPSYFVVAELARARVLHGELPKPEYPDALRQAAQRTWWNDARLHLAYAKAAHASRGHVVHVAGAIARATCEAAHAILASRGQWVTNEKTLLDDAGLRDADAWLTGLEPGRLVEAVDRVADNLAKAIAAAQAP